MSDQTLWELAEEMHCCCYECQTTVSHKFCAHSGPMDGCDGCRLEQWARERAKKYLKLIEDVDVPEEVPVYRLMLNDLGVTTEEQ